MFKWFLCHVSLRNKILKKRDLSLFTCFRRGWRNIYIWKKKSAPQPSAPQPSTPQPIIHTYHSCLSDFICHVSHWTKFWRNWTYHCSRVSAEVGVTFIFQANSQHRDHASSGGGRGSDTCFVVRVSVALNINKFSFYIIFNVSMWCSFTWTMKLHINFDYSACLLIFWIGCGADIILS